MPFTSKIRGALAKKDLALVENVQPQFPLYAPVIIRPCQELNLKLHLNRQNLSTEKLIASKFYIFAHPVSVGTENLAEISQSISKLFPWSPRHNPALILHERQLTTCEFLAFLFLLK